MKPSHFVVAIIVIALVMFGLFAANDVGNSVNAQAQSGVPAPPNPGWIVPSGLISGGETDNHKAIQNTVDEVSSAGGGAVYLPAGVYGLAAHVKIRNNVRIIGAGMGATVIKALPAFRDAADRTWGCMFVSHGMSNLHYSDFTITGASQKMEGGGIRINSRDFDDKEGDNQEINITIERVEVKDYWGKAIRFGSYGKGETHSSAQITIRDCRFENLFNPNDPFEDVSEEFTDDGRMDAINGLGAAKRVTITGNFFKNLSGNAIRGYGWWYTVPSAKHPAPDWMDIIITGNHIERTWMGIEFEGYLAGSRSIIANNTIKWMHKPGGAGYAISAGGNGLKISGNYIEQVEQGAIEIGGTGILFEGNTIKMSVQKQTTDRSVIQEYNKPSNIRAFAMFAATASQFSNNLLIYDPVYDDGSVAATQMWGISLAGAQGSAPPYDDGGSDVVSILNNTMIGFTQRAIQCTNEPTENVYIKGNVFRSRFVKQDEPIVLMWGHRWFIENNTFDFTGATTSGPIVRVHDTVQKDNTRSLITRNTIVGDGWKIDASEQYQVHDNRLHEQ